MKGRGDYKLLNEDKDFISHMVQMKGDLTRRPSKVKSLFISHMVQMKASASFIKTR